MNNMIFQNASQKLTFPTHEGSGQAVHPTVIDFLIEHNKPTWGGYRYWMAMTPYPFTNDAHEDPNIIASNDNVNWVVPNGIINPLDDALGGMTHGFHNDPDMVYNPDTNEIWLYYRFSSDAKQETKLIKIKENMTVTSPQVVMLMQPFNQDANNTRSFCVWRESSTKWHMWGSGGARPYKNYYFSSADGITWSAPTQVLNPNGVDPFHAIGYENWHMSCKPNKRENRIEFLTYCWVLGEGHSRTAKIIYSEVAMSNPSIMTTPNITPVLSVGNGWDNGFLYRCSFVIEDLGDSYKYHLWYSAVSGDNVWGIGYTNYSNGVPLVSGEFWKKGTIDYIKGNNNNFKVANKKVKIGGRWVDIKGVFVKK